MRFPSLCQTAPQEFDGEGLLPRRAAIPCQSPLVFLSCSVRVWHVYRPFNGIFFCASVAQLYFVSVRTLQYLNGIKQMWRVEYQLNGHWRSSVISPSTLHAVCDRIRETDVWSSLLWQRRMQDLAHFYESLSLDNLPGVSLCSIWGWLCSIFSYEYLLMNAVNLEMQRPVF